MIDQCRTNASAVASSGEGPDRMKWLFPCTRIPTILISSLQPRTGNRVSQLPNGRRLVLAQRPSSDIGSLLTKKRSDAGCSQADRNHRQNFRQAELALRLIVTNSKSQRGFEQSETRIRHPSSTPLILHLGSRSRARRPPIGESSNEKVPS